MRGKREPDRRNPSKQKYLGDGQEKKVKEAGSSKWKDGRRPRKLVPWSLRRGCFKKERPMLPGALW